MSTKEKVKAIGKEAFIYTADLASKDEVAKLIPRIVEDGHDIDILVNCAGIQRRHPSHLFPQEDWDEVKSLITVSLTTTFHDLY